MPWPGPSRRACISAAPRGVIEPLPPLAIPTPAEQAGGQAACLHIASGAVGRLRPLQIFPIMDAALQSPRCPP